MVTAGIVRFGNPERTVFRESRDRSPKPENRCDKALEQGRNGLALS